MWAVCACICGGEIPRDDGVQIGTGAALALVWAVLLIVEILVPLHWKGKTR